MFYAQITYYAAASGPRKGRVEGQTRWSTGRTRGSRRGAPHPEHLGISEKQPDISSSEHANTPTKPGSRTTQKAAKRTRRHQRRERYAYQPDSDSTDATPGPHQRPSKRRTRTSM